MDVFNLRFEIYQCNAIYGCIRKMYGKCTELGKL